MAAMMGFSSFGGPPAKKKRKFNSSTDAFVSGQELEKLDKGGKNGKGSGGNQIPLGKMRTFGNAGGRIQERKVANEEEISLDDDDEDGGVAIQAVQAPIPKTKPPASPTRNEEEINLDMDSEEEGPQYEDTSHTPPALSHLPDIPPPPSTYYPPSTYHPPSHQPQVEEDEQSQYMDTSLPPPITAASEPGNAVNGDEEISRAEKAEMQARIDRLLTELSAGATSEIPLPAPGTQASEYYPDPGRPQSYSSMLPLPPPGTSLPARPMFTQPPPFPPPSSMSAFSDTASMASSHDSHGRGRGRGGSNFGGSSYGGVGSNRGGVRGQRNEKWYEDYYDPSFNQNPWAEQEEKMGLEAKGKWLERGHWVRS